MHPMALLNVESHRRPLHEFFVISLSPDPKDRSQFFRNLTAAHVAYSKVTKKISIVEVHLRTIRQSRWNLNGQAVRISFLGCCRCWWCIFIVYPQDNNLFGARTVEVWVFNFSSIVYSSFSFFEFDLDIINFYSHLYIIFCIFWLTKLGSLYFLILI